MEKKELTAGHCSHDMEHATAAIAEVTLQTDTPKGLSSARASLGSKVFGGTAQANSVSIMQDALKDHPWKKNRA